MAGDGNGDEISLRFAGRAKSGFVAYQIGGYISDGQNLGRLHFPVSELRFPLKVYMAQVQIIAPIGKAWAFSVDIAGNGTGTAGTLEDRDWGVRYLENPASGASPDTLDVYSESRAELTAIEAKIQFEKMAGRYTDPVTGLSWSGYYGFGLAFQDYDYRALDITQYYPSTNRTPDAVSGLVLTYHYRQFTPLVQVRIEPDMPRDFRLGLALSGSPLVRIDDEDNHVIRNKTSKGATTGWMVEIAAELNWMLTASLDATAQIEYSQTAANGKQEQHITETATPTNVDVALKHINEQTNFSLGIKWSF